MRPNVNWSVGIATEKHSAYASKAVKAGIPFASQVTEPDTKYIIKYDFDLGGNTATVPENSILEFDGGCISNGTLNFNKTLLDGNVNINAAIAGTVLNEYLDITWFGCIGDDETDNTSIIKNVLSICVASKCNMYIPQGVYAVTTGKPITGDISYNPSIDVKDVSSYYDFNNIVIYGDGYNSILKSYYNGDIINLYCSKNLYIENIAVTSGIRNFKNDGHGQNLMSCINAQDIHVSKCLFKDAYWEFKKVGTDQSYSYTFDGGNGISFQGDVFNNVIVTDCDIENCAHGLDMLAMNGAFSELDNSYCSATNIRIRKCFIGVWASTYPHKGQAGLPKITSGLMNIQARCTDCVQAFKSTTLTGANIDIQAISTQTINDLFISGYGTTWMNDGTPYSELVGTNDEYGTVYVGQLYSTSNCNVKIYADYKYLNIGYRILGKNKILSHTFECENNYYNLNLNEDASVVKRIGATGITDETLLKVYTNETRYPFFKSSVFIFNGLGDDIFDQFYRTGYYTNSLVIIANGKLQSLFTEFYEAYFHAPGGNTANKLINRAACICGKNEISENGIYLTLGSLDPDNNISIAFNGQGDIVKSSVVSAVGLDIPGSLKGGGGIVVRETSYPFDIVGFIPVDVKRTKGATSYRPSLDSSNSGFMYYDIELRKMILWNGTAWTNVDGTTLVE